MKYEIEHLGKTFNTIHFDSEITDEHCEDLRNHFFQKPFPSDVKKNIENIHYKGSTNMSKIYNYYFYELMSDCKLSSCKWSIKEFIGSNDLIRFGITKTRKFPNIYPKDYNDIQNLKILFRLSPSGTAGKLSNFPLKTVQEVLDKYNTNNLYYDFSAGWGVRMLGALSKGVNYVANEPNTSLVEQLQNLTTMYKEVTYNPLFPDNTSEVEILNYGSETFTPHLENKVGLAFSSPPYFNLEEYSLSDRSNQSTETNKDYTQWKTNYLKPTIQNIYRYLTDDGYLLFNIKNFKEYKLFDDSKSIIESLGFKFIESFELKNVNRPILSQNNKHSNEEIMVFTKSF